MSSFKLFWRCTVYRSSLVDHPPQPSAFQLLHPTAHADEAARAGNYDVLIGADGACSAVQSAFFNTMISTVQMVMQAQMPYTVLRDGVLTHPTMTEGLNLLFSKL
ncbi:MAG TPA: hypothetical protein V6D18_15000 [Thermosynechococcaceae cyanobacterium]